MVRLMTKNYDEGHALEVDHIQGKKLFETFGPCKVHIDGDMTAEKGILRMAGGSEVWRKAAGDNVVLSFGLSSFNTQTGLASKHSTLEKRLVTRAKSLEYVVLGAHEYYTSAK
ncbi:hypothetical protein BC939DRAFT_491216 [Gamsiella multidivaricata]|uniref:uncharacterized protein n=1 Tax=Gamsiella multidivaricata TaxID=101098 RepID=UPI002220F810|nr:uncharacterized protein BC939DRAFT_491216 [Gamsiella multidivaricata]KAI7827589.1 hypothetical protein BC939DRAFT_491216 [Gamsiella multidivaricata]